MAWRKSRGRATSGAFEVVQRYFYDPFGMVDKLGTTLTMTVGQVTVPAPISWLYLHKGGYYTPDSLYHFRHRSYDPNAGQWMQRDPVVADSKPRSTGQFGWFSPTCHFPLISVE